MGVDGSREAWASGEDDRNAVLDFPVISIPGRKSADMLLDASKATVFIVGIPDDRFI